MARMRDARHSTVHVEYTEFSRPHTITSVCRMAGMDIEGTLDITAEGGLTRLSWTWKLDTHGPLRLINPVARAIGDRQEHSSWARLKDHLERPGTRRPLAVRPPESPS